MADIAVRIVNEWLRNRIGTSSRSVRSAETAVALKLIPAAFPIPRPRLALASKFRRVRSNLRPAGQKAHVCGAERLAIRVARIYHVHLLELPNAAAWVPCRGQARAIRTA
jgi:hypothetical protein